MFLFLDTLSYHKFLFTIHFFSAPCALKCELHSSENSRSYTSNQNILILVRLRWIHLDVYSSNASYMQKIVSRCSCIAHMDICIYGHPNVSVYVSENYYDQLYGNYNYQIYIHKVSLLYAYFECVTSVSICWKFDTYKYNMIFNRVS